MDSPFTNTLTNVAGRGLGVLAALNSIKQGGLANYFIQRQRLMADPNFRATLAGSPFTAGVFEVSGDTGPTPAPPPPLPATTATAVAQPGDLNVPAATGTAAVAAPAVAAPTLAGYLPGTPRAWTPNLPPLALEQQLAEQERATTLVGMQSRDPLQSGLAKTAAGIMPTRDETNAVLGRAAAIQKAAGAGSTVGVKLPGMTVQIGSPYNLTAVGPQEYATPAEAAAAARPGQQVVPTNRDTFMPMDVRQPTAQELLPAAPPPVVRTPGPTAVVPRPGTNLPQPASSTVAPPASPLLAPAPAPAAVRPAAPPPSPPPAAPQPATPSVAAPPAAPELPAAPAPPPPAPVRPAPAPTAPPTPPPAAPTAAARPAAPVTLPAPAPPYLPPGIDPNALAPSVRVPARPAAPVGFPPPAPAEAAPNLETQIPFVPAAPAKTRIVAPPVQPTPPPQGPSRPAVDPATGAPLQKVTRKYQSGEEETFATTPIRSPEARLRMREVGITNPDLATPAQIAAYEQDELSDLQRQKIAEADITRMRRGGTEGENTAVQTLMDYRNNLNKFLEDFPTADARAPYIGYVTRPWRDILEHFRADPTFQAFVADLAPFQERFFERAGSALTTHEIAVLAPTLPTGGEVDPAAFEARLQRFNDRVNDRLSLRLEQQSLPMEEQTPAWANGYLNGLARARAARRLLATVGAELPATTTTLPPPTTTLPPAAPPPAATAAPLQILGDWQE